MANENVKIIVQEFDETRPKGSGASSDIVYVPGLGSEFVSAEYRNVPVLCSSVDEFEGYFGSSPYRFTAEETINGVTVRKGDYDRAYIYAKELINAGLTVLYEDISADENAHQNIATFTSSDVSKVVNTKNVFQTIKDSTTANIAFDLEGVTAYGKVSLVAKAGECNSVTINSISVDLAHTGMFTVNNNVITWEDVSLNDLETVMFTANVTISGAGQFSLSLVVGDVGADVQVTDPPLKYFYDNLAARFENLNDKNEYTVKYMTSGGYPTFNIYDDATSHRVEAELARTMLEVAKTRNDCIALIDHNDRQHAPLAIDAVETQAGVKVASVYKAANEYFSEPGVPGEFGAMFTPWGNYTCVTMLNTAASVQALPASFGYLMCLATAIKTSPNWLAMAGVTRGIVPNLKGLRTNKVLSNVIAEDYQPKYGTDKNKIAINAITNVKPYGLTIWGNRTLKPVHHKGTVATNFLNTRNMISDIKKLAYNTAKSLMFEQDSDTLWLSFKSGVSPLLDQLKSGFGISDYKLIRSDKKYDGRALTRGEMAAIIKIFPLYAIEYFEITVVVSDNDVAIS